MALFDLPLDQLERYRSDVPEPADFDAFWASSVADARRHDVLVDVVPVATGLTLVETWDVTFAGFDGHPVRAWYTRPARRRRPTCPPSSSTSATGGAAGCRRSG